MARWLRPTLSPDTAKCPTGRRDFVKKCQVCVHDYAYAQHCNAMKHPHSRSRTLNLVLLLSLLLSACGLQVQVPRPVNPPANTQDLLLPVSQLPAKAEGWHRPAPGGDREQARVLDGLAALQRVPVPLPHSPRSNAFVSEYDRGNGEFSALVAPTMMNYRDPLLGWQMIDARWDRTDDGFVMARNTLQAHASTSKAELWLRHHEGGQVGWQPQALLSYRDSLADAQPLAHVLGREAAQAEMDAASSTLTYRGSWSAASIAETLKVQPNALKQALVFDNRSALANARGEWLSMRALLFAPAGAGLYAGDARIAAATTLAAGFELRDVDGKSMFQFQPVIAHEQADAMRRIGGRYTLNPLPGNVWEIGVETPLAWWLDAARVYPAVLDPTMAIKQPQTVGQMSTYVWSPALETACQKSWVAGDDISAAVGAGRNLAFADSLAGGASETTCAAAVRFDTLPVLPFNSSTLSKVELVAAPIRGRYKKEDPGGYNKIKDSFADGESAPLLQAFALSYTFAAGPNQFFFTSTVGSTPIEARDASTGARARMLSPQAAGITREAASWNLPLTLVASWYATAGANKGIGLYYKHRYDQDEYECEASGLVGNFSTAGCELIEFPLASTWTPVDLAKLAAAAPAESAYQATQGAGFLLRMTYNVTTGANNSPRAVLPPTAESASMHKTFHVQGMPVGANFTAVGVKGLSQLINNSVSIPASGNYPVSDCALNGAGDVSSCGTMSSGNVVNLLTYRGGAGVQQTRIDANQGAASAQVVIEASQSVAMPALAGGVPFTIAKRSVITVTATTQNVVRAAHINLPLNENVLIRMGNAFVSSEWSLRSVLPPGGEKAFVGGGGDLGTSFNTASAGTYGIVASYNDKWNADACIDLGKCLARSAYNDSIPAVFTVYSCPGARFPTEDGRCMLAQWPNAGTPYKEFGTVRLYSEGGFVGAGCLAGTAVSAGGSCYADLLGAGNDLYVPFIGAAGEGIPPPRLTGVIGNNINGGAEIGPEVNAAVQLRLAGTVDVKLMTKHPTLQQPDMSKLFGAWVGNWEHSGSTLFVASPYQVQLWPFNDADVANSQSTGVLTASINIGAQSFRGKGRVLRNVPEAAAGTQFDIAFENVQAEGYVSALASPSNHTPSRVSGATEANNVAGLTIKYPVNNSAWEVVFNTVDQQFTYLYADGFAVMPESMGAAYRAVKFAIAPGNHRAPTSVTNSAATTLGAECAPAGKHCLDVRNDANINNVSWKLPDTKMGAGTALLARSDAPDALSVPFDFRSFGGVVEMDTMACPNDNDKTPVTVISGTTRMAIPMVGSDTDDKAGLTAQFVMCRTSLRGVKLKLSGPEVPLTPTPIVLYGLAGSVDILPSSTQIAIYLDYYIAQRSLIESIPDHSFLALDTAGRIYGQTEGIYGETFARYLGQFQVAWNPLDIDVKVQVDVPATGAWWVQGKAWAHVWRGQGWQNKYSWLPNDDKTYFSAGAELAARVPKGGIVEDLDLLFDTINVPPSEISLGKISAKVGDFCNNAACNSTIKGAQGLVSLAVVLNVVGLGWVGSILGDPMLGIYIDTSLNPDFVLGSNGKTLADQTLAVSLARDDGAQVIAVDPGADTFDVDFNVPANSGLVTMGATWAAGNPQVQVIRPDSSSFTLGSAPAAGAVYTRTEAGTNKQGALLLFLNAGQAPNNIPGIWKLRVTGAANAQMQTRALVNRRMPTIAFTAPLGSVNLSNAQATTSNTPYTITWNANGNPDAGVSLYYTLTSIISPTERTGVIAENLRASTGQYAWNLAFEAAGSYKIHARVAESITPTSAISNPTVMPGFSTSTAPGVLILADSTGPSTTFSKIVSPLDSGAIVCWQSPTARDTAGYVLRYTQRSFGNVDVQRLLRAAMRTDYPSVQDQCARLTGLPDGIPSTVEIASYDVSDNLGTFFAVGTVTPTFSSAADDPPGAPGAPTGSINGNRDPVLGWAAAGGPGVANYTVIAYGPRQSGNGSGPNETPAGTGTTATPTNLRDGCIYDIAVQAHYTPRPLRYGPLSATTRFTLTNGIDANSDGIPDDVQACMGYGSGTGDDDGDGLSNADEWGRGTRPDRADTDGDGMDDGAEVDCGSNPLLRGNVCVDGSGRRLTGRSTRPNLFAEPPLVTFVAFKNGPNPGARFVNVGYDDGARDAVGSESASWLSLVTRGTAPYLAVDKSGLAPGIYETLVTYNHPAGKLASGGPKTIRVRVRVYDGGSSGSKVMLPLVTR